MKYTNTYFDAQGVTAQVSAFTGVGAVDEWHVILHVEPRGEGFQQQMQRIYAVEDALVQMPEYEGARYVLKRYFLSDAANQQSLMREESDVAISCIQQQPMDGSKIGVWLYLQRGTEVRSEGTFVVSSHNGYRHLWRMGMVCPQGDSAQQTETLLVDYEQSLDAEGATLADNCIRTWFYVRDVDTQYAGLVRARRENFVQQGLTSDTHYIASTGIGGGPADTKALVQLGTYALTGMQPEQQQYLYARTHLNPTYEYGVTFERGTALDFGDRRHVYISGTASINNRGEVEHVGDIVRQTHRMWENVQALLTEAGVTYDDVAQLIVYLRDTADYEVVRQLFAQRFPHMPVIITLAPVCRPAWLIEMECVAVKAQTNESFRAF